MPKGSLGSCTANVASMCLAYMFKKEGRADEQVPSRLWIYWYTRVMIAKGDPSVDSGASMRDTWKSVIKHQACPEPLWVYDIRRFAEKPDMVAHQNLCRIQSLWYERVPQDMGSLKSCLAQGFPISLGIRVYQSFMDNGSTGRIPTPDLQKEVLLGGHAVILVGYDDSNQVFIGMNSWGQGWGDKGFFTIGFRYILDPKVTQESDLWTVKIRL
ncbi:hypothetical protein HK102_008250 [Quaeritorhiza haematococci]|nr:hypothetical protein HK102_008250 [Quaeritorhiza haematococci]